MSRNDFTVDLAPLQSREFRLLFVGRRWFPSPGR